MTTFPYYKYGNPQNYRKWRGKGILKFRINKLELPRMFEPMTFDAVFPAYIQTCYFQQTVESITDQGKINPVIPRKVNPVFSFLFYFYSAF